MAGLQTEKENKNRMESYKQRLGIALCSIYATVYIGFVAISIYDVTLMDILMPFGLNLAVFYGMGLIIFALILAMIYSLACSRSEKNHKLSLHIESEAANSKGGDK